MSRLSRCELTAGPQPPPDPGKGAGTAETWGGWVVGSPPWRRAPFCPWSHRRLGDKCFWRNKPGWRMEEYSCFKRCVPPKQHRLSRPDGGQSAVSCRLPDPCSSWLWAPSPWGSREKGFQDLPGNPVVPRERRGWGLRGKEGSPAELPHLGFGCQKPGPLPSPHPRLWEREAGLLIQARPGWPGCS